MTPQTPRELAHLKPTDSMGALYTLLCLVLTGVGIGVSQVGLAAEFNGWVRLLVWLVGQVVLAFALLQWFVLLHECGHGVLFKRRALNVWVGHLAGFFCTIPFRAWTAIHSAHHKWTGWQDLDPTTAPLVPRTLGRGERALMNFCWKFWVPAFAVLYRVSNFWNLGRLKGVVHKRKGRVRLAINACVLLVIYALLVWQVGPVSLALAVGPGIVLSLVLIEPIMISQHSHIPLNNSHGDEVKAYKPQEQEVFTRSLRFPDWFSRVLLLHFDAHELHHVYPYVPGYRLRDINHAVDNEAHWWKWILMARKMPAEILLFKNRNDTGSEV